MKLALVRHKNKVRIALQESDGLYSPADSEFFRIAPDIVRILQDENIKAQLRDAREGGRMEQLPEEAITFLPPIPSPAKILCVGLNYSSHAAEASFTLPRFPVFFARFASGLVGHGNPLIRPQCSSQLDYEGELVAVIGRRIRNATVADALDAVVGYSIFNDGTIRDYQLERGPQWTLGKNFDGTGGFGPVVVSADELPKGGAGLEITTRLNGEIVQKASTAEMIFSVPHLIAAATEAFVLEPGDLVVTGTPSGVGAMRKPPLYMKAGDFVEVSIQGIGVLKNHVVDAASVRLS